MSDPIDRHLERVYRRLDPARLGAGGSGDLSPEDLALGRPGDRTDLMFQTYSEQGILRALKAYGTLGRIGRRVGGRLTLRLDLDDPFSPRLIATLPGQADPAIDITLSQRSGSSLGLEGPGAVIRLLFLESIVLQRPGVPFTWERPPLPHQAHPGLTLSGEILQLLLLMQRRLATDGFGLIPKSAVSAAIFSRFFRFVDPEAQHKLGAFRALSREAPLWYTAWAAELGCVRHANGKIMTFAPSLMLSPLTPRARALIAPRRRRMPWSPSHPRPTIDQQCLRSRFPWERMPQDPVPPEVQRLIGERPASSSGR